MQAVILRLLLGDLARAPERVRARMLESVPTTPVSLAFYSITLIVICSTAVYISGETWALVWLGASLVLIAWRTVHPILERRKGRPQPLGSIMVSSGLAMASFGFGSAESIATGDVALISSSDLVDVRVASLCKVKDPAGLVAWWTGNGHAYEVVNANRGRLAGGRS